MNRDAPSRLPVARVAAASLVLILVGVVCFYIWVSANAAWGTVGTLRGYDVRAAQNKAELELRDDLHQWLERKGLRQASLPNSMVDARGNDLNSHWAKSSDQPVVYTASRDGHDVYVVTWSEEDAGVRSWMGQVYYRTVPSDVTWLPGVEAGGDSAKALFVDARSFLQKARDRRRDRP